MGRVRVAAIGFGLGLALVVGLVGGFLLAGYLGTDESGEPVVVAAEADGAAQVPDPVARPVIEDDGDRTQGHHGHRGVHGWWGGDHCELLADFSAELGVAPADVVDAARTVVADRLRAAADEGRLSDEKVERLLTMFDAHAEACAR